MKKSDLKIGQKVLVIPAHTNKDLPPSPPKVMYVQELTSNVVAGLSHRKNGKKHVYGIVYDVIHPISKTTRVKLEFYVLNDKFEAFAEYLQGIKQFTAKTPIK